MKNARALPDTATTQGDDQIEELASETRQFVTFITGDEVFAVDMTPVQEIIRVPEVVRVPLAPATLEGLANLRGKVLPIVSLRRLFGFAQQPYGDATRAVVIDYGQPLGFVVDRVASVIGVEPRQIEDVGAISTTINADLLSGLIKDVGGHSMIMVLDFAKLIEKEFAQVAAIGKMTNGASVIGANTTATQEQEVDTSDELQLVSFDIAGQEYAIAIQDVQEIVQIPETIVQVPRAQAHVLGVMMLRSRLLPVVDLRCMFGLPDRALDDKSRIVILTLGGASVGIAVDAVSEVLRVPRANVDALPPLLARDGELSEITEICRLDSGKRLVSLITARNLFDHSAIKEAFHTMSQTANQATGNNVELEDAIDDDEQVVVFLLGLEEFGAPIANVQEIVRVPADLARVPQSAAFVEGVVNLRGSVMPVIDLRLRLGLEPIARSDRQRIVVFLVAGVRAGFIVDQVAEVLKIPKSAIEPSPQLSGSQGGLLSRMANLEMQHRMVQLLDPTYLLTQNEADAMAVLG